MKRFNRIHAICRHLRHEPCKQCPAREDFGPGAGRGVRGCYVQAREVANIAKYGYPWPPPYNARQRAWRKRPPGRSA